MQSGKAWICGGCLNHVSGNELTCNMCGTNKHKGNDKNFLEIGTILDDKYLVGGIRTFNGEHVMYIGKDLLTNKHCLIKEYAPTTLSTRLQTGELAAKLSKEIQYKTSMVDFLDLHQTLRQLNSIDGLVPIENVIVYNKTVYIIYPDVEFIKLEAYLNQYWKLSWADSKKWAFDLNNILINVHNNGIIHRGISPETIYVATHSQKIFLWSFSIASMRTKNTQMQYELFDEYSAPEQYFSNKWQGEWTDVYSTACVFLRILTGRTLKGLPENFFTANCELNRGIPQNVLNAIQKATKKNHSERTQTIRQFNAGLLAEYRETNLLDATVVFDPASTTLPALENKEEFRIKYPKKSKFKMKILLILALGLILTCVAAYFLLDLTQKQLNTKPQKMISLIPEQENVSKKNTIKLPSFVGELYENIAKTQLEGINFLSEFRFDDAIENGLVILQTPLAGIYYNPQETLDVSVVISKGPETVDLPQILDRNIDEVTQDLDELGVKYEKIYVETTETQPDIVYQSNWGNGAKIKKNKDTVLLYLKKTYKENP
ncbi:MAG: hypothetical protein LBJ83_01660 [Oscillospiraceae bacterium]|jgi:serine/threonine-protein kinase|nr:hypothetical protein [Oscillospiraceae bacterium]